MMNLWPLVLACFAVQEPEPTIKVHLKDQQVLQGRAGVESVKLETALGASEIKFKDLLGLTFEGESVTAQARDMTRLKGKLVLDSLTVRGVLGEVKIIRDQITKIEVQHPGTIPALDPAQTQVTLSVRAVDGNEYIGTVDLTHIGFESSVGTFKIDVRLVQTVYRLGDKFTLMLSGDTELRGTLKLQEFKIKSKLGEFTVQPDKVNGLGVRGLSVPTAAGSSPKKPPQPSPPSSGPSPAPVGSSGWTPANRASINSVLASLKVSKDGRTLYGVNVSDGKLCRWTLPDLKDDGTATLPGGEKSLSLDPAESMVVAVGQKNVSIIERDTLAVRKTFPVEITLEDVHAVDTEHLVVTGAQGTGVISISRNALIRQERRGTAALAATPAGDRIYIGDWMWLIDRKQGGPTFELVGSNMGPFFGNEMVLSPDGRLGCSATDQRIFRLGRCWVAAKVPFAPIERHTAAAFSTDGGNLYLFTQDGFMKVYETKGYTLQIAHHVGLLVTRALALQDGKSIVMAGAPLGDKSGIRQQPRGTVAGMVVDLYRFEIPK